MKTNKIFSLLAAIMMAATFTACSNDDYPVKPSLNTSDIDSVVWDSTNVTDISVYKNDGYEKAGIKVSCAATGVYWADYSIVSYPSGMEFFVYEGGGFTFTNTLGKKFTKIVFTLTEEPGWDYAAQHDMLGPGWPTGIDGDLEIFNTRKVTWTGKAEKVDLLVNDRNNVYPVVPRIVFYLTD